jgi:hypothetical protein
LTLLAGQPPELLVTEIRLGPFNGLHLVLRYRGRFPDLRAIAVNPFYDSVLAYDAANFGATYVTGAVDDTELVGLVKSLLVESNAPRRWPRMRPANPLVVQITNRFARVFDLSYEGLRIETHEAAELPESLTIVFPDVGVAVEAEPVWSQPSPVGSWWCGARISLPGQSARTEWRHLVDATAVVA